MTSEHLVLGVYIIHVYLLEIYSPHWLLEKELFINLKKRITLIQHKLLNFMCGIYWPGKDCREAWAVNITKGENNAPKNR